MRPKLSELCDINPQDLRTIKYEDAVLYIITELKASKVKLVDELMDYADRLHKDYDYLSTLNWKIQYLDRTIESRTQDYEEMINAQ